MSLSIWLASSVSASDNFAFFGATILITLGRSREITAMMVMTKMMMMAIMMTMILITLRKSEEIIVMMVMTKMIRMMMMLKTLWTRAHLRLQERNYTCRTPR